MDGMSAFGLNEPFGLRFIRRLAKKCLLSNAGRKPSSGRLSTAGVCAAVDRDRLFQAYSKAHPLA